MVNLPDDKFTTIDENLTYIFHEGFLYLAIGLPAKLNDVIDIDNVSGSGKTFRVYTNGTNRKFIKNSGFKDMQIQLNMYLSEKDASKLKGLTDDQLDALEEAKAIQKNK